MRGGEAAMCADAPDLKCSNWCNVSQPHSVRPVESHQKAQCHLEVRKYFSHSQTWDDWQTWIALPVTLEGWCSDWSSFCVCGCVTVALQSNHILTQLLVYRRFILSDFSRLRCTKRQKYWRRRHSITLNDPIWVPSGIFKEEVVETFNKLLYSLYITPEVCWNKWGQIWLVSSLPEDIKSGAFHCFYRSLHKMTWHVH